MGVTHDLIAIPLGIRQFTDTSPSKSHGFVCDTRESMFSHAHMPIGENLTRTDKNTPKRGVFHKL